MKQRLRAKRSFAVLTVVEEKGIVLTVATGD
jgi:hypothetical protein